MADFVAVLRKTLDGLGETTPEVRARVYDKARSTIAKKLAAIDPPPPAAVAERQKQALEDAKRAEEIRDEARTWIETATREIEEREKMKEEKGQ